MSHEIEEVWTTKAGLKAVCLIVRGSHRCGYVEVPLGHPLHGVGYSEETEALNFDPEEATVGKRSFLSILGALGSKDGSIPRSPEIAFNVHGGLTYANSSEYGYPVKGTGWWFGFDCAHLGDGLMDPRMSFLEPDAPVRSKEFVKTECEDLANQIVTLTSVSR